MIRDTQSTQISQKQDERNIYAIMKAMCLTVYRQNGFLATHALGHMKKKTFSGNKLFKVLLQTNNKTVKAVYTEIS